VTPSSSSARASRFVGRQVHLTSAPTKARDVVEDQVAIIQRDWDEVAAAVGLSRAESDLMRLGPGAQILNRANTARRDNFAT
jgi:hypothetical protein